MTDPEFERLRTQLQATARNSAPPGDEASSWVHVLDTAGAPDRWWKVELYQAFRVEDCRRRRIPIPEAD